MDKLEKLAKQIFTECEQDSEPITMEEALEMAEMEVKAKGIKNYVRSVEPTKEEEKKKKTPRTVKVSDEKISLFNTILTNLDRNEFVERENITVIKENKLIQVKIGDKLFKIDLIQQRNK
jgi:hypothetical protein